MRTIERDGEILAELCDMMNTNVFQLRSNVAKLQEASKRAEVDEDGRNAGSTSAPIEGRQDYLLQEPAFLTGRQSAGASRNFLVTPATTTPALDEAGALATYLRSVACVSPGVYKGERSENFREFIRTFKRKYESVISCEATLVEILGDDHLGGEQRMFSWPFPKKSRKGDSKWWCRKWGSC